MQLGTHLGISTKLWGNEGMLMVVAESAVFGFAFGGIVVAVLVAALGVAYGVEILVGVLGGPWL